MSSPGLLLSNVSIKQRLPLLIGALLVGVIGASTLAAYRGVKDSALEVGHERLLNLTQQLASLSQQSTALLLSKTFTAVNDPAVRAFLQSPSPEARTRASRVLQQFAAPQDSNGLQTELWDANGNLVLTFPEQSSPVSAGLEAEFKQTAQEPLKTAGALRIVDKVVVWPALAVAKSDNGAVIGYLVRWRRVSASPEPRRLRDLLGSEATLYFGNTSGDVWTDLTTVVPRPPTDLGSTLQTTHYTRNGESVMALGRPIGGTPFFLIVEFPDRLFSGQALRFLRRILIIDLALLLLGVVGTLRLSRSITRPLNLLTGSATGICEGDYSRMVHINRNDELGALGNAFNTMVTRLRGSQIDLERNVHELKSVENSASELAAIVESSQDAIVGRTLDGTITSWNQGATKLYGYSAEETVGHIMENLSSPDGPNEIPTIMKRIEQGERIGHFETERIAKDGKAIPVSLTVSPILDDAGAQVGTSTIARDITRHKKAEEALQSSEIRYRRLFESAKDGILILEADSGRIIDVNPFLLELLGDPKEELMGQELWELGPFRDIVASKAAFVQLQDRGYLRYDDLPLQDRDGIVRQVEFVSNSYLSGEKRVIQCNIRDITERKLAEEDLRQANQRLEGTVAALQTKTEELAAMTQQLWQASKLATMGELAASIAHELNNPLATVALRTENLLIQLPDESDQRKPLEIITQEVDRMAGLVENLLQFSRRSHRQVSTVDVGEEIANSLGFVHYHLRNRNIEVVREFADSLPTIQADRQHLRQLFLNLLTNAGDAMPQGGTLTVSASPAVMGDAEAVTIEFADTGEGITAENFKKIWEPFFTTKPEGKGTGLGLAICRRIVEEHGGTIEIRSEPGKGATVRIVFPATQVEHRPNCND